MAETFHGFSHLLGTVATVEKTETFIRKSLCAHRNAINGKVLEGSNIFIREVVRIAFYRHLKLRNRPTVLFDSVEKPME